METFSALLALCDGYPPVTGGFSSQRPVMRSFDVFFDLRLHKRLSKQSGRQWFESPSRSLWRHCHDYYPLVSLWQCFTLYLIPMHHGAYIFLHTGELGAILNQNVINELSLWFIPGWIFNHMPNKNGVKLQINTRTSTMKFENEYVISSHTLWWI